MTGMSRSSHGRPGSVALASSEALRGTHLREVSSLPGGVARGGGVTLHCWDFQAVLQRLRQSHPRNSDGGRCPPQQQETEAGRGD